MTWEILIVSTWDRWQCYQLVQVRADVHFFKKEFGVRVATSQGIEQWPLCLAGFLSFSRPCRRLGWHFSEISRPSCCRLAVPSAVCRFGEKTVNAGQLFVWWAVDPTFLLVSTIVGKNGTAELSLGEFVGLLFAFPLGILTVRRLLGRPPSWPRNDDDPWRNMSNPKSFWKDFCFWKDKNTSSIRDSLGT